MTWKKSPEDLLIGGRKPQVCPHGIVGIEKCKTCVQSRRIAGDRRRRKNPEYRERKRQDMARSRSRRTPIEYAKHFETQRLLQQNNCSLCGETLALKPCKDPNHATGQWRGVLCPACNLGLGHVEKRVWLETALAYLKKWEGYNG